MRRFLLIGCCLGAAGSAWGLQVELSPAAGVEASLVMRGQEVDVSFKGLGGGSQQTFVVDTEKTLKIHVEDYNFDGYKDFSISHVDDGMGTTEIYQVYVYSIKQRRFISLSPKCGDEFVNLVVDRPARTLINSWVVDNRYVTCKIKF